MPAAESLADPGLNAPQPVLIALGGNLGARRATLDAALADLARLPATRLIAHSRWFETKPAGGPPGQGAFLNGAASLATSLSPAELWQHLAFLEHQAGRERGHRWAARPLDLDLLLHGSRSEVSPELILPHPRLTFRPFVLLPAVEIAGDWREPDSGWTLQQLVDHLRPLPLRVLLVGPRTEFLQALSHELSESFPTNDVWLAIADSGSLVAADQLPLVQGVLPSVVAVLGVGPRGGVDERNWVARLRRWNVGPRLLVPESEGELPRFELQGLMAALRADSWPR